MILKKPYAFIIKHFRLIHLILFGCFLYLFSHISTIHQLFSSLHKSTTYIYAGADTYIDKTVYFIIFVSLILSSILFWLLKSKKKPTGLYLSLIIYYSILIVGYAYLFSTLKTIQENILEADAIIFCKDISNLLSLPMYVFMALCFIRGIGFNLKQFNFSRDIKELQIADQDSEEFELLIGQNNYKYIRTVRRTLRETKYYILENKFALTCIGGVIAIIIGGLGISYYNQYMKKLSASEVTTVDSISYVVNKSYVTAYDYNGIIIKDGYKYVIIDMKFHNSSTKDKSLNLNTITLADGKLVYYPTINCNGKFYDLGVPYQNKQVIAPYEEVNATLTFEIPASARIKNFTLRVQYGLDSNINKVVPLYRKFDVSATNIDSEEVELVKQLNETINVDTIGENKFSLTITSANLADSYNSRYAVCSSDLSCRAMSNVITTTTKDKNTMLVIDYRGTMYEDANFTRTFNTYNKVFENYVTVRYKIYNKEYTEKAQIVAHSDIEGKVFLVVDRKIYNASEISLALDFRNNRYIVPIRVVNS